MACKRRCGDAVIIATICMAPLFGMRLDSILFEFLVSLSIHCFRSLFTPWYTKHHKSRLYVVEFSVATAPAFCLRSLLVTVINLISKVSLVLQGQKRRSRPVSMSGFTLLAFPVSCSLPIIIITVKCRWPAPTLSILHYLKQGRQVAVPLSPLTTVIFDLIAADLPCSRRLPFFSGLAERPQCHPSALLGCNRWLGPPRR